MYMNFSADVSLVLAQRLTYGSILPPIENYKKEKVIKTTKKKANFKKRERERILIRTFEGLKRSVVEELGLLHQMEVVLDAVVGHFRRIAPIEKVIVIYHTAAKIRLQRYPTRKQSAITSVYQTKTQRLIIHNFINLIITPSI